MASRSHNIEYYIDQHNMRIFLSDALISSARLISVNKGEALLTQDNRPSGIYFLVEGRLQIEHYDNDGRNIIFTIQEPLSIVGDIEMFYDGGSGKILSTVSAISPSVLLSFSISTIRSLGLNDPEFLLLMCRHLAKKAFESSINKIAVPLTSTNKLRRYFHFQRQIKGDSFMLEKRDALASMLGISVRQLTRAMSELKHSGVIRLENKTVFIIRDDVFYQ
ncbi:conserved hypothetical protein [Serratia proteamaculans]|uniref:Crp/Fnr family transcriptional regulator n=1 Tax=Serratia proteamaculans TaxID=28151 RepID=UPI0009F80107|nr:Crp/Fnr family transcriptional regulator [Serratia proteamaculans]SMB28016.1 conserved hypothetical protein [Serratia proteamaculans]